MRKIILGSVLGFIFLLAACANEVQDTNEEPTAVDSATPTAPGLTTDTPDDRGYPAPVSPDAYPPPDSNEGYPEPAEQEGYPAPSEAEPTQDPYPGGFAVIEHPAGFQCEDAVYPDLKSVEAALEEAGITVQESEEVELVVCEACGCPTSLHYQIEIDPADLDAALSLGWERGS